MYTLYTISIQSILIVYLTVKYYGNKFMKKLSRREKEKQMREAAIISAAEQLFSIYGYANVSMDQIAKKADFTKRTIYQYFQDKDDLFYGVITKTFTQLAAYCGKALQVGKNGFDKIRLSFFAFHSFHRDFPAAFKLMNQIKVMNKVGTKKNQATPKQKQFQEVDTRMFQAIAATLEEGQRDGSIRKDIDPAESSYALAFITTGFFTQLAETGESFTKNLKLDPDKFIKNAIGLLSDILRPR